MIPPLILDIRVGKRDGKGFRLFFPLVILWPVLGVLLILVLPVAAVVQVVLSEKGIKPFNVIICLILLAAAFRGLIIDIKDSKEKKWSEIKIKFS